MLLDSIGRDIVSGRYDGCNLPTEFELAKAHAVSRSSTREALKMLMAKGLIRTRTRRGTSITPRANWNLFDPEILGWLLHRGFSIDLLRQFTELRIAIEPEAASLAARSRSAGQMGEINAALDAMRQADRERVNSLDADIAFHVAVLRATRNPFYCRFEAVVSTALRTSIGLTNEMKGRPANFEDHAAVAAAIELRDEERARLTMRHIILEAKALIAYSSHGFE